MVGRLRRSILFWGMLLPVSSVSPYPLHYTVCVGGGGGAEDKKERECICSRSIGLGLKGFAFILVSHSDHMEDTFGADRARGSTAPHGHVCSVVAPPCFMLLGIGGEFRVHIANLGLVMDGKSAAIGRGDCHLCWRA